MTIHRHEIASQEAQAARTAFVKRGTPAVVMVSAAAAGLLVSMLASDAIASLAALASIGVAAIYVSLRSPVWALVFLLMTMLLRLALPHIVVSDPFIVAFAIFAISSGIWLAGNPKYRPKIGAVEVTMTLFIGWNVYSILQAHDLPALIQAASGDEIALPRYLFISTVVPFVVYFVSRAILDNLAAIRILLSSLLIIGAYSAAVSIMQFTGPRSLVWPRYIVDAPNWIGRANGLSNQPNTNGIALITGYAVAVMLATAIAHPRWRRALLWVTAIACAYGVYLTHTRAVYLGFVLVVIIGAAFAKGARRPFVITGVLLACGLAVNWSTFTSGDRDAGGVGSTSEVYDRLNSDVTAIWAFFERPWFGWGLGRTVALNTYHHQRWSAETPWTNGFGSASHFNELGILAELGIVGLALWLGVLFFVFRRLVKGVRMLPAVGLLAGPMVLTALMCLSALVMIGFFVDLRLLDYPSTMTFALAGAAVGVVDRVQRASDAPPYVRLPRMRF